MDASESLASNARIFDFVQTLSAKLSSHSSYFLNVMRSDETYAHALQGGAWGLVKTAIQEWPHTFAKCMSLFIQNRSSVEIAKLIFNEMILGSLESEVTYDVDDRRQTFAALPKKVDTDHPLHLQKSDFLVVTGGGRGITASCLIELAKTGPCKILLLGRSSLMNTDRKEEFANEDEVRRYVLLAAQRQSEQLSPRLLKDRVSQIMNSRDIYRTLTQLQTLGCEVHYEAVDCADFEALNVVLNRMRKQWGPVRGLIHGAGVIHDRLLGELSTWQYDAVFSTKVQGALNLLKATEKDPLQLLCFFSSVAARWGNKGQSVYAMANEILNKLAHEEARKRPHCRVKSIGWGPWQGGMVNDALQKVFEERKIGLIPIEAGCQSFVEELQDSSVEVLLAQKPFLAFPSLKIPPIAVPWELAEEEFHLGDHRIRGIKVVPFAVVLEWVMRISQGLRPDLQAISLTQCVCYHGISAQSDGKGPKKISFHLQDHLMNADEAILNWELKCANRKHYKLHIRLSHSINNPLIQVPIPTKNKTNASIYDGEVLFHGLEYQILEDLSEINPDSLMANIRTLHSRAMILDGGIQLALLWMWKRFGRGSLPSSIQKLDILNAFSSRDEKISVQVIATKKSPTSGEFSVVFRDESKEILAIIEGLQLTSYFEKPFPKEAVIASAALALH